MISNFKARICPQKDAKGGFAHSGFAATAHLSLSRCVASSAWWLSMRPSFGTTTNGTPQRETSTTVPAPGNSW